MTNDTTVTIATNPQQQVLLSTHIYFLFAHSCQCHSVAYVNIGANFPPNSSAVKQNSWPQGSYHNYIHCCYGAVVTCKEVGCYLFCILSSQTGKQTNVACVHNNNTTTTTTTTKKQYTKINFENCWLACCQTDCCFSILFLSSPTEVSKSSRTLCDLFLSSTGIPGGLKSDWVGISRCTTFSKADTQLKEGGNVCV